MALNRIACPECGAGLKSPTGFAVGQHVNCPKCETYFTVEGAAVKKPVRAAAVDDDEYEDRPKGKKRKGDDEESSYKNSWMRYAVLGVLVVVLGVLGYMLYDKKQKEKEAAAGGGDAGTDRVFEPRAQVPPGTPMLQPKIPAGGGPDPVIPNPGKGPNVTPKKGSNVSPGGGNPVDNLLFGTPLTPAESDALMKTYRGQIVGTWKADLGSNTTVEIVYGADGKVSQTIKGPGTPQTTTGEWSAAGLTGRKGVVIVWTGNFGKTKPEKVIFEDDEMQHGVVGQPGLVGIFRK